jgi:hypothetical protein
LLLLRTAAGADGLVSAEDAVIAQNRIVAQRRISGSKDQPASGSSQSMNVYNDLVREKRGATGAGATEAEVSPRYEFSLGDFLFPSAFAATQRRFVCKN